MTVAPPMLPSAREVTLLTNVRPLPPEVQGLEKWRNGLQFAGNWEGLDAVQPEAALCADPGSFNLPAIPDHPQVQFKPFFINTAHGCAAHVPETADEVSAYAVTALEQNAAAAVGSQFWSGTADQTIPHLQAVATVVAGGPYSILTALARLIDARWAAAPSVPMLIHGPAGMVVYLEDNALVTRRNNWLVGADGWRYVPGAGYPKIGDANSGPWNVPWVFPTGFGVANSGGGGGTKAPLGATTATQTWFYATGAVEYDEGPIFGHRDGRQEPFNPDTFWDPRTNRWVIFPQREVIYRFDPFNVFAILVTVPA